MELAHSIRREEFGENESFSKKKASKYNNKLKNKCTFCDKKASEVHHLIPQKMRMTRVILKPFIKTIKQIRFLYVGNATQRKLKVI